jgi:hypothetical protein
MIRKIVFTALAVAGLATAGLSPSSAASGVGPAIVYATDFELAPGSIQSEAPSASWPLHAYLEQSKALSLVDTMSTEIVEDLTVEGIAATRLTANDPLPKQGWLVRGVFAKVDKGDRVKRAVIGFRAYTVTVSGRGNMGMRELAGDVIGTDLLFVCASYTERSRIHTACWSRHRSLGPKTDELYRDPNRTNPFGGSDFNRRVGQFCVGANMTRWWLTRRCRAWSRTGRSVCLGIG